MHRPYGPTLISRVDPRIRTTSRRHRFFRCSRRTGALPGRQSVPGSAVYRGPARRSCALCAQGPGRSDPLERIPDRRARTERANSPRRSCRTHRRSCVLPATLTWLRGLLWCLEACLLTAVQSSLRTYPRTATGIEARFRRERSWSNTDGPPLHPVHTLRRGPRFQLPIEAIEERLELLFHRHGGREHRGARPGPRRVPRLLREDGFDRRNQRIPG